MKNIFKIIVFLIFILVSNVLLFSQNCNKDTLFFNSYFDFRINKIEIIDTCNGQKVVLNSFDGKHKTPKIMIVDQTSKVFKVVIHYRFLSKKIGYLQLSEIKTKYVYIYVKDNKIQFDFPKRIKGRV